MAWAPLYVTDEDLRGYLRVDDLEDEAQAALAITAASRAIDDHTNRQFGKTTAIEERFYTAWPDYERCRWVVTIDDIQSTTGLVLKVGTTNPVTVTTYRLEPVNALAKGRPWTHLAFTTGSQAEPTNEVHGVSVTATWGWTTVPDTVKQATLLQASRVLKRRDAPFGVAGSPELGSELRLLAKIDPDVAVALRGYGRVKAVR